jgi:hypothetical protein
MTTFAILWGMIMLTQTNFKKLYELDFYLWIEKTIEILKIQNLNDLDLENLIEELESLGKRDFNKVRSLLRQIIVHLLLLEYWSEEYDRNYRHWRSEIVAFRDDLRENLTTTLKNKLIQEMESIYSVALNVVINKTGLFEENMPLDCPYFFQHLLDKNWYPHHED